MQRIDVLEDIRLLVCNENKVELILHAVLIVGSDFWEDGRPYEKLVNIADIFRLNSCVLGTRICEFRERCE